MKDFRSVYKQQASDNMAGKYGDVIPVFLVTGAVTFVIGLITSNFQPKYMIDLETFLIIQTDPGRPDIVFLLNILGWILATLFLYGTTLMFIQTSRNQNPHVDEILTIGFKEQQTKSLALNFLTTLFVFLWTLLFIIPGIVMGYAYSMGFYLIHQEPKLSALEAIDLSKKLTKGSKLDLWLLDLSYLGWYILGIFTLGILWLWITPKHMTARTLYFEELYYTYNPRKTIASSDVSSRNTDIE